jgi:tetratricopeptide (TPR) repeat protein
MPLGLELLASQLRGFMPEQVVQAVEGNLTRLQTDLRTIPARHRSLQAVFEWSWSLLAPTQQRLFSQLSVFRGGFEAEAAQAVVGATWPDLLELWERSLLRRHESGRLEMHELLSQFAQEKLTLYETAYAGESVQDRHSYYYITLLNLWEADLLDENLKQALAECRRELDNIRQAWQWAISRDRFEWIGRSLSTIVSIYDLLGLFQEAVTILEAATARARAREAVTTNPAELKTLQKVWGQLLVEQSHFLYKQARYDRLAEMAQALLELGTLSGLVDLTISGYLQRGKAHLGRAEYGAGKQDLEQSLAMARQAQLPILVADSLYFLGTIYQHQGRRTESKQYFEQALAYYHQQGHQPDEEELQNWLLTFAANQDYAQGKAYFEQRLNVARQRANPVNQARLLHLLARLCLKLGEYGQARLYEEESLEIAESLERPWLLIPRLNGLSAIACSLNEAGAARQYGFQALEAAKALKNPVLEGLVLVTLGQVLSAQGELAEAARFYKQALALRQAQGKPEAVVEALGGLAGVALARRRLSQARTYVEEVLTYLEAFKLELIDEPFTLCLACYHVLRAGQDPRAELLLDQAHTLLQTRAARISEATLRRSFLENVPANREIITLHEGQNDER